jgi:hypothetical protein
MRRHVFDAPFSIRGAVYGQDLGMTRNRLAGIMAHDLAKEMENSCRQDCRSFCCKLSKTVLQAGEKKKFSFRQGEGIKQMCLVRLYANSYTNVKAGLQKNNG